MNDPYQNFKFLSFDRPSQGLLRMTLSAPNLNSVGIEAHTELTKVWSIIDSDPQTNVVMVTGAGRGFSAGGSFELIEKVMHDYGVRSKILKEARDLVFNILNCSKLIVSAVHGPAVGAGLVVALLSDISVVARGARIIDGHTRLGVAAGDHAAICWPLMCGMAKAKYYLLTSRELSGEEAERIGLVSMCVEDSQVHDQAMTIARDLSGGAHQALRWTKHSLNHWFRAQSAVFDASLAYEFMGFGGPDVVEGLASHRDKRRPIFPGISSA